MKKTKKIIITLITLLLSISLASCESSSYNTSSKVSNEEIDKAAKEKEEKETEENTKKLESEKKAREQKEIEEQKRIEEENAPETTPEVEETASETTTETGETKELDPRLYEPDGSVIKIKSTKTIKNGKNTYEADTTPYVIKGNSKSMIYHVPGQRDYDKISTKNVVHFATKEDAEKKGYRPAAR